MVTWSSAQKIDQRLAMFFAPVEVPLVSVEVYVSDKNGRPVPGLTLEDFEIFEDGNPVTISHFYAAPGVVEPSNGDPPEIDDEWADTGPEQDPVFVTLELIAQLQGRQVMILLSDGVDTHSVVGMPQVFDVARKSNALVYWISISGDDDGRPHDGSVNMTSAWKDPAVCREQFQLRTQVVNESGGRILDVDSPDEIRPVFIDILKEFREQYVLGFYPKNRQNDGRWHKVKVGVAGENVEVRAPKRYIDHCLKARSHELFSQ